MGLLSQVEENQASAPKADNAWRNVALRVVSYDVENRITTGVDVGTGETIRIKLAGNADARRDDVDVWSTERFKAKGGYLTIQNNKAVVAGDESEAGVIIFEAARPSKVDGVMEARWSTTASHSADEASVFQVMARPIADKANAGQVASHYGIEMVRPIMAAPVKSKAEITEQISNFLSQPFTQAVVRAMDEDGKVLSGVVRRSFTPELRALTSKVDAAGHEAHKAGKSFVDQRTAKRKMRAELASQFAEADANAILVASPAFFEADPLGRLISKLSEEQLAGLKLEVFPLEQVYPGDKYKEALGKFFGPDAKGNSVDANSLRRDWSIDEKGFGFADTLVALRQHEEGGLQVTKIRPASTRPMLYVGLNDIPTPNIQPAAAPVMGRSSQAAQAADSESSGAASPAPAGAAPADAGSASGEVAAAAPDIDNKLAAAARSYARR